MHTRIRPSWHRASTLAWASRVLLALTAAAAGCGGSTPHDDAGGSTGGRQQTGGAQATGGATAAEDPGIGGTLVVGDSAPSGVTGVAGGAPGGMGGYDRAEAAATATRAADCVNANSSWGTGGGTFSWDCACRTITVDFLTPPPSEADITVTTDLGDVMQDSNWVSQLTCYGAYRDGVGRLSESSLMVFVGAFFLRDQLEYPSEVYRMVAGYPSWVEVTVSHRGQQLAHQRYDLEYSCKLTSVDSWGYTCWNAAPVQLDIADANTAAGGAGGAPAEAETAGAGG